MKNGVSSVPSEAREDKECERTEGEIVEEGGICQIDVRRELGKPGTIGPSDKEPGPR
jgi:hypothetical protein